MLLNSQRVEIVMGKIFLQVMFEIMAYTQIHTQVHHLHGVTHPVDVLAELFNVVSFPNLVMVNEFVSSFDNL
jgi:hypothetical protein